MRHDRRTTARPLSGGPPDQTSPLPGNTQTFDAVIEVAVISLLPRLTRSSAPVALYRSEANRTAAKPKEGE